ncbi:MAG: aldo/keto reductase [Armatimonadota bacterium]
MVYRKLGNSSLEVPAVIFGAWAIGGWAWGPTDDAAAEDAIRASLDAGVTCIDTAPIYGCGHSEEVVGKALKGRRESAIIATKCGLRWDSTEGEFHFRTTVQGVGEVDVYRNLRPDSIRLECERSLVRLQTDYIDLYQCHWPDPTTPLEDTMEALLDLRQQGKIREIGVSNFTPEMMRQCLAVGPIASDQPRYSLLDRSIEEDVLPFCRDNGIGVIVYSPIAQGLLTGRVTPDREFPPGDLRASHPWFTPENRRKVLEALEQIRPVAESHGCTLGQLAIAWVVHQPGVTSAIAGARTADQARENAAAADVRLSADELQQIRQVFEGLVLS